LVILAGSEGPDRNYGGDQHGTSDHHFCGEPRKIVPDFRTHPHLGWDVWDLALPNVLEEPFNYIYAVRREQHQPMAPLALTSVEGTAANGPAEATWRG
jgi:hypothetical protein